MGSGRSKPALVPSDAPVRPPTLPPIPPEMIPTPARASSRPPSLHQSGVRLRTRSLPPDEVRKPRPKKIYPGDDPLSRRESHRRSRHRSQVGDQPHPLPGAPDEAFTSIASPMDYTGRIGNIKAVDLSGFSDVRKGVISSNGMVVAIQSLPSVGLVANDNDTEAEAQRRVKRRLAREMRLWVDLKHPRILTLVGFAFVDDRPCLLSPWCKNGNVLEYLSRTPSADRQNLVRQVAEGLAYLHSLFPPVVHGDVKSRNVMIIDSGDAVLCDFGLSKRLGDGPTGMTTPAETFMSLRYAAAEILRDEKPTMKTNVYSFACVALEILTDKCPFFAVSNTGAVINLTLKGVSPAPSDYPELLAGHPLWHLFGKCWAGDPKKRPTMEEVLQELDTSFHEGRRTSNISILPVPNKSGTEASSTSKALTIPEKFIFSRHVEAQVGH